LDRVDKEIEKSQTREFTPDFDLRPAFTSAEEAASAA